MRQKPNDHVNVHKCTSQVETPLQNEVPNQENDHKEKKMDKQHRYEFNIV
uniref:Uncharacterized protein n=1 Tax=Arion vulgaris TaxID=1028688 RepID=A0A0B6YYV6_9EUPU